MANIVNTAQKIAQNIVQMGDTQTSRLGSEVQARRSESTEADLFLKRSAAYYHAQTASSLDSVANLRTQRDPVFQKILQSLAPENTNFSPSLMHSRLKAANSALKSITLKNLAPQNSKQKIDDKELLQTALVLQQRIEQALNLQQEASDNQRLLIRA